MKPGSPFTQTFDELPDELPIYPLENALLPGGQLPLELSEEKDLTMFLHCLKTDQLIGMVQPDSRDTAGGIYQAGCAGRIRQYRERGDGRLNIMLAGVCRYRIIEELPPQNGYRMARVDWSGFEHDYEDEEIDTALIDGFMATLKHYFERHNMQVDWKVLDELPIEQVVNNLVLIINLDIDSKQRLLEAPAVRDRLRLFSELLQDKAGSIHVSTAGSVLVN